MLQDKTIIVGVTGGIAAYKSCELVSRLKKLGAAVWVVMTKEAAELVGPLTFRTLSGNPVVTDLFAKENIDLPLPHISLAEKADLIVIAPCTANIIGKIAHGIADDPLTTIVMASTAKKLLAPAMNCEMWRNPIVSENIEKLKKLSFNFIGPEEGNLACGKEDIGRMSEPEQILKQVIGLLGGTQDMEGKNVLVTAGGTREAIDPVRYIANHSSGKMGYALAAAARARGARVTLISANVSLLAPLDVKPVKVVTAGNMLAVVNAHLKSADIVIMAAAVADYVPRSKETKFKKKNAPVSLELQPTPDILKTIAGQKGKILVGFALETEDAIKNAKLKLKEKKLDLIIANDPSTFGRDSAQVSIIDNSGKVDALPQLPKKEIANRILDKILSLISGSPDSRIAK